LHAARRRATIAPHEGDDHAMSLSRRRFLRLIVERTDASPPT